MDLSFSKQPQNKVIEQRSLFSSNTQKIIIIIAQKKELFTPEPIDLSEMWILLLLLLHYFARALHSRVYSTIIMFAILFFNHHSFIHSISLFIFILFFV